MVPPESKISSVQPLLNFFERLLPLTDEERDAVISRFHPHLYRKRQYPLQHGDICQYFHFVVKGCLRLYKADNDGGVHILQFATEDFWMTDLASFYQVKPSKLNIDALEDTVVLRIMHGDLIELYTVAPKFHRIFRVLLENQFMQQQERIAQLFSSTAEERYQSFLEEYPHLQNRLSQVQIASYLGITPEFLSRIRNKLAKG